MSPFRWDVLGVTLLLLVPVVMTSGSFTVSQLAIRMGACLLAATLGVGLLRALATPGEPPPAERDRADDRS